MKSIFTCMLVSLLAISPSWANVQEVPPPAYQIAANRAGIPSSVLYAVALQESGRNVGGKLRPWPWALNVKGKSYYFDTFEAACIHLTKALKTTSPKRVDAGLGQINVGYHGQRVKTPCDLLHPYINLDIAATILKEQHRPGQDWLVTMGKYHSPANGAAAARYRASVQKHWNRMRGPQR